MITTLSDPAWAALQSPCLILVTLTVPVAVSTFDIKTAICIFTDECWRPWYTYDVPPSIYLDKGVSSLRDGGAHWAHA